jgi:hypothetical protein
LAAAGQPTTTDDGVPYDFRCLRRVFSTTLRRCKVDRELREKLMGQSSKSVNTEHYTDDVDEELFDAVRRLPLTWNRKPPGIGWFGAMGPTATASEDAMLGGGLGAEFGADREI